MIFISQLNLNSIFILIGAVILTNCRIGLAQEVNKQVKSDQDQINQLVNGQSGGSIDSQGCGFIADNPNYEMNLERDLDYLRLTVRADGGQPTLLVLGPNSGDSFCILGDEQSGLQPEISGVWESGGYQVYIGDRLGERHKFNLNISTEN